ncbi:MAG TPA: hypothetical protein PKD48_02825 [Sphingopyxis sp.]|nr:hypothetical protein [Sphingopyxis sp.]HMQ17819.1 hypothetical protein [Sphingopyxis sp.]
MQNPVVRGAVAIVAGMLAAMAVVALLETAGHMLYPPPPDLDITKPEDQARLMTVIPTAAKIAVVVAWFLGALAGGVIAAKIGKKPLFAWVIGAIMVALAVYTTTLFPHPAWMVIAAVALPIVAAAIAIPLSRSRVRP